MYLLCSLILFFFLPSSLTWFFFFFNDTATTEIYTLSLHDALPISSPSCIDELHCPRPCRSYCYTEASTGSSDTPRRGSGRNRDLLKACQVNLAPDEDGIGTSQ